MRALRAVASGLTTRAVGGNLDPVTFNDSPPAWAHNADLTTKDPLAIGTVFRCVSLNASGLAGCPVRAYDTETHAPVVIPAFRELTGLTSQELHETVMVHLQLWGNAYLRMWRNPDGHVIALVPIHPASVQVIYNSSYRQGAPLVKKFRLIETRKVLTEDEVLHIPSLSEDGVLGMSVIAKLRRTFGIAVNIDRSAERLAGKGMRIAGILTTESNLEAEDADDLKKRFAAKTEGPDAAGTVPVLSNGITFERIDMNPIDAQFLESRRFQVTEIARLFGIPGWMVNDQEKSTSWGTGMEQQFTTWVTLTLKPPMQRIEQRYRRSILIDPESTKCEFQVEGLLRGDSAARAAFYQSGIANGWLVPNEVRALEDLPPVTWGDEPYLPFNQPASAAPAAEGDPES